MHPRPIDVSQLTSIVGATRPTESLPAGAAPATATAAGNWTAAGGLTATQSFAEALTDATFGQNQFGFLDELWERESGWNPTATNPTSGAYGIPQALPAEKMTAAGADWQTDPYTQIVWGIGYIQARYGTPQAAWAHEQSYGWY